MARQRRATSVLQGIDGGKSVKSRIRRAFEACRASDSAPELQVVTVLSEDDENYAEEVAELLRERA